MTLPEDPAPISDEELAAMALAADPHVTLSADAVAWTGATATNLLPEWYMPTPMAVGRRHATLVVLAVLFAGFLVVDACGLCITYGFLSWA